MDGRTKSEVSDDLFETCMNATLAEFDEVTRAQILGRQRAGVWVPRAVLSLALYRQGQTHAAIGERTGGRGGSSSRNGVERLEGAMATDAALAARVDRVLNAVELALKPPADDSAAA